MNNDGIKEISMDARFINMIETGKKTRTARMDAKANVGDVVSIFNRLYVITERKIYPFERLVKETWSEEGFNNEGEFSTALYRIYGTEVYGSYLYSHKFKPYHGEITDQLQQDGHEACFGCSRIFSVPVSSGGEIYCRNGNRCIGSWNDAQKTIDIPKRCCNYDGDKR